ncbi:MAG: glucose-1-phosphate thymidylyltransferase, glucose-1-phosphate thymidylyltransferase [Candidatus Peregrinibacteria bacterium GW2011_GWE2_39_6]|nr:MAG: glucose-1-phosphate thymidylyltransferase, glucose-1-phosphate thymidylyltransferase [Candidatus Peregrinibacteria bacterium GW2011_GWF2_39_17]KKR26799.1 MAG: glucose-1-phosphate thymidylyltransferase, glucose-1-phosphate thymidylyltransferase [Candidatus Peregrinibacteria bacterium GW2011_GWE2_39_6]HCW32870.1 spore coat protein [Candidatus Peregrinibacteria bacterium]
MKGIILAGGFGNRLKPLTDVMNKHLLPIYNKPMIYYPLQTLLEAGIRDILIVTGPEYAGGFIKLLGSGEKFNCNIYFAVQEKAGGIAQALNRGKNFANSGPIAVILGDNLFEDNFKQAVLDFKNGAMIFIKEVTDPERFGVVEFDQHQNITAITEKPQIPSSPYAVTGFYLYDQQVFDIIQNLTPSKRQELEITDVNNAYLQKNHLQSSLVKGNWTDAGTFESLHEASLLARNLSVPKNA